MYISVFTVGDLWDVGKYHRLSLDELIQEVLLKSLELVLDNVATASNEGIVAVRQENGLRLLLIDNVTMINEGDGNLEFTPNCLKSTAEGINK